MEDVLVFFVYTGRDRIGMLLYVVDSMHPNAL